MKANPPASTGESNRTVLMVDGHGKIRTIQKFHQKLRIGIALSVCAVLVAAAAGWLYVDGLQTQRELQQQIDTLRAQVTKAEHQKELLLVRAVKAEAQIAPGQPDRTPASPAKAAQVVAKAEDVKPAGAPVAKSTSAAKENIKKAAPSSPPETAAKPEPVVSVNVDNFKIEYQVSEKALTAEFVIRNTGNTQAQGRAVVVLSSSEGDTTPRLSMPSVPLKNDRPRGNRGRRFSISRFMRLNLQRKVAEPGLRFDTADVFAFDMKGNLLQEKTFKVAVSIPVEKQPPPAAVVPPAQPAAAAPAESPAADPAQPAVAPPIETPAANSILAIPSNSEQEPQGGQED